MAQQTRSPEHVIVLAPMQREHLHALAVRMCRLASAEGLPVRCRYLDVNAWAYPGFTPGEVIHAYWQTSLAMRDPKRSRRTPPIWRCLWFDCLAGASAGLACVYLLRQEWLPVLVWSVLVVTQVYVAVTLHRRRRRRT